MISSDRSLFICFQFPLAETQNYVIKISRTHLPKDKEHNFDEFDTKVCHSFGIII